MSVYTTVQLEYNDGECLANALRNLGYQIDVHDRPVPLHGYTGDQRTQKAHIVIRRKNTGAAASNDIGFLKKADGCYDMIISDYDRAHKQVMANLTDRLKQEYGVAKFKKQVKSMGMTLMSEKKTKGGQVQMKIRVP
jgi:hypothetical protein